MVDMFYVNWLADSTGINLVVHYNALKNADADREKIKISTVADALSTITNVCSATDRPVTDLQDIFLPPDQIVLNERGGTDSNRVVKMQLFSRESGITGIKSVNPTHMPGRVSIGDISADGFPDIMLTMRYENGTDRAHILLNSPC